MEHPIENKKSGIVSLVPSITETLYALGLDEEVAGITKFCVHPKEWFRSKTKIGGTKTLNIEKIRLINPHLVIASKEENIKEQVEELAKHSRVLLTDVNGFDDALGMIRFVGKAVGKEPEAETLATNILQKFKSLPKNCAAEKAAYLIWRAPWMAAGGGTFIADMMRKAGFENIFSSKTRYPRVSIKEIQEQKPTYILLSSEPFPFKQKHVEELKQQLPESKILLADGEMFSWYGSRMLLAPQYFTTLRTA